MCPEYVQLKKKWDIPCPCLARVEHQYVTTREVSILHTILNLNTFDCVEDQERNSYLHQSMQFGWSRERSI